MISPTSPIGWTGIVCSASADTKVSFSSVSVPLAASKLLLHFYSVLSGEPELETFWRGENQPPSPAPPTVLEIAAILLHVCVEFRLNTNIPKLWWLHWAVAVRVPNPRCSVLWSSHTTRQRTRNTAEGTRGGVGSRNKAVRRSRRAPEMS